MGKLDDFRRMKRPHVGKIDDRGLELAEAILHDKRHHTFKYTPEHAEIVRAIKAVGEARKLA